MDYDVEQFETEDRSKTLFFQDLSKCSGCMRKVEMAGVDQLLIRLMLLPSVHVYASC